MSVFIVFCQQELAGFRLSKPLREPTTEQLEKATEVYGSHFSAKDVHRAASGRKFLRLSEAAAREMARRINLKVLAFYWVGEEDYNLVMLLEGNRDTVEEFASSSGYKMHKICRLFDLFDG